MPTGILGQGQIAAPQDLMGSSTQVRVLFAALDEEGAETSRSLC